MIMDDRFNQAVQFATNEIQGFYDRGGSFRALNQKGRSEILEVFSDGFDWEAKLNNATKDFHSFDSLRRHCAYLIRAERKMPDKLKHWISDILEGVAPTLKQPPGKVASGLENNMFIPRLVEKVAIKFKLPRTRGTNDDEISACDAVHLALLRVPAAIEIGSRQYETIRRAYANAQKAGIFIGN
jgi:hypothetical protein